MSRFVLGEDRKQATLLPECLDDWVDENNAVRAIDVFVDALSLSELGFEGVKSQATKKGKKKKGDASLFIHAFSKELR